MTSQFFKKASMNLSGEEEIIARPKGHNYTKEEEDLAISEMTFYGSSKWCEMVKKWQNDHPQKKVELTLDQKSKLEKTIKKANQQWKKIQKTKKDLKEAANKRIEKLHDGYLSEEIQNDKIQGRST